VNVLIALLDRWHVFHARAHAWFDDVGALGWATCPLVENGAIRILAHPRYKGSPGDVRTITALMRTMVQHERHEFWAEDISLLDESRVDATKIGSTDRITDTYLLALAAQHGGRFATFDRKLSPFAVRGGPQSLHVIA
jgi:uncharacterized protein